jgi:ElaA protein
MKIRYKQIETINEFIDAIRIRIEIFIIEQKCPPGYDPDELDKVSKQYIAIVDNKIVAMVRLREDPKKVAKIENMVVKKDYRGKGIGTGLTEYVIKQATENGYKKIWMQAQEQAKHVFEKAGFKVTSKPYDLYNLGIPHVDMEYTIK